EQCGADGQLVALCQQCLSADRDVRPPDAAAVAAALTDYLAGVEDRARRAEVEWAAAEARAAEQRKGRRGPPGLAATVVACAGLVGFGLWWQDRVATAAEAERAVRESRTSAGVGEALHEARQRAEEAWQLSDFPDRMQHATDVAMAAMRRAEELAG